MARGIDDLDFFIGDEALDATGYSVKVCLKLLMHERNNWLLVDCVYRHTNNIALFQLTSSHDTVSNQAWNRRGLGSDGKILGTEYL